MHYYPPFEVLCLKRKEDPHEAPAVLKTPVLWAWHKLFQGAQGCGSFRLCRGCWEPLSPRYVLLSGLGRHCSVEMGPPSTPGTTGRCLPSVSLVLLWFPMSSSRVLGLSELIFLDQGRSSGFKKNGSLGIKQIPLPAQ